MIAGKRPRPPTPADAVFLTVADLCQRWRIARATLERGIRAGTLPAPIRFGRCRRWPASEVARFEAAAADDRRGRRP
jgi:predicted DNA-binding transcriptional regulator AlpA